VVYAEDDLPSQSSSKQHVFFSIGDHMGSTGWVIDKETSELVEASTYQAHGARDSEHRPARWGQFREEYGFTGKEEDIEIGLTYFGARYYSAALGRWISADPLTVHGLGANANPYADGTPAMRMDPNGLDTSNESTRTEP
jgi:RHS repeat-associated protein